MANAITKSTNSNPKRRIRKKIITRTGVSISKNYCRKCMKELPVDDFYQATDTFIDSNGVQSVCKNCLNNIYDKIYSVEFSIEKTILRMCRTMNIRYLEEAVTATKKQIETFKEKGKTMNSPFGVYLARLRNLVKKIEGGVIGEYVDNLEYHDVGGIKIIIDEPKNEDERVSLDKLKDFWGDGFGIEDYQFLERKISEWKRDYSCQNKSEELIIKELCFKELELNKARVEGRSVDGIIKTMDTLLKSGGLSPAQTTASSGKTFDTIGMLIKQIENTTPAEFYEDKELFKDFDGLERYFINYIKRPIMNFIGASKSFEITDDNLDSMEIGESSEESGNDIL